jgi:hypothetical protein
VRSGIWTSLARYALLNLERRPPEDGRNWRPHLMVFTGQPHNREHLVDLAEWLSRGQGLVTFFQLIVSPKARHDAPALRAAARKHIRAYVAERRMAAFAEAQVVADFAEGAVAVTQAHGVGALESNTALMGWSGTAGGRARLLAVLRDLAALGKSALFLRVDEAQGFGRRRVLNVWWRGRGGNADLMLLLAYLVSRHPSWDGAELRLTRVIARAEGRAQTEAHMADLLDAVRVPATLRVVVRAEGESFADVLRAQSAGVDLTFLGLPRPADEDACAATAAALHPLVEIAGTTLLVHNAAPQADLLEGG